MKFTPLKGQVQKLKKLILTVYFAARDPRTPFMVRSLAVLVAAYALSPIDLVPDFIPVLGYLDDLLLVPLGLAMVVRFTPPVVVESARSKAEQYGTLPTSYAAAAVIVFAWVLAIWFFTGWLFYAIPT